MKQVAIIQPGRLGDIIICLPIAKFYADRGYKVIWPICDAHFKQLSEVVDYVTFISVTDNIYHCVSAAYQCINKAECEFVFDIAATFPDSTCTDEYVACGDGLGSETFDAFKYRLCRVPIEEKWKLTFTRNKQKEQELFDTYVHSSEYVVTALEHSKGRVQLNLDTGNRQIIPVNQKHNLFHWIKIFEEAKCIVCVESSISNLIDQLNLPNRKFLRKKSDGRLPLMKSGWILI